MAKTNKRRDAERRSAAAAKVAEMQRAQRAKDRRRQGLTVTGIVVALIIVLVGAFVLIQNQRSAKDVAGKEVKGVTADYGFVLGKKSAPVKVIAYEDFQCPVCKNFEDSSGDTLSKYVKDGTVQLEYRPIAFLDQMSSTQYSTRSLNAAACVMDADGIHTFKKFHDSLYANQPPENGDGLPDSQLVSLANKAGANGKGVATCIKQEKHKDWTASATEAASKSSAMHKGLGTPAVLVNGDLLDIKTVLSPNAFKAAIDKAAKKSK
ncbi:MAG: DsbA family protein [Nocardioidaceae bacterium]